MDQSNIFIVRYRAVVSPENGAQRHHTLHGVLHAHAPHRVACHVARQQRGGWIIRFACPHRVAYHAARQRRGARSIR